MKKIQLFFTITFSLIIVALNAQNTVETILSKNQGLYIGGYGQIDMNLPISDEDIHYNAKLDVHRFVTFIGYNFNEKSSFVSELEFEHVSEVYVEQAFLNHGINENISLQAGLMLIPMGIQNLYHEPPTFNGVERTNVDKYIIPTTWREMGIGLSGDIESSNLNYQMMIVNGFNGYSDGAGVFSGSKGLRSGRQKGAESYMTSPDLSGRISYYGVLGLNIGLSLYKGESETELYNGLDMSNDVAVASADSSKIGIEMLGVDARYHQEAFQLRGQYIYARLSNTLSYNMFTGSDLGSLMTGYYIEGGYNLFHNLDTDHKLVAFTRYENYNTHAEVESTNMSINDAYNRTDQTIGLTYLVANGAAFKIDYQFLSNAGSDEDNQKLNLGVAVWF